MKKVVCLSLALLLGSALAVAAQSPTTMESAYESWKVSALGGLPDGLATPHYFLMVVPHRKNGRDVELQFFAAGKMSGVSYEIQPLRVAQQPDGKYRQTNVGKKTFGTLNLGTEARPTKANFKLTVRGMNATAFEIKWTPTGGTLGTSTVIAQLSDDPSPTFMTMIEKP